MVPNPDQAVPAEGTALITSDLLWRSATTAWATVRSSRGRTEGNRRPRLPGAARSGQPCSPGWQLFDVEHVTSADDPPESNPEIVSGGCDNGGVPDTQLDPRQAMTPCLYSTAERPWRADMRPWCANSSI
jgi:hypothetical protein